MWPCQLFYVIKHIFGVSPDSPLHACKVDPTKIYLIMSSIFIFFISRNFGIRACLLSVSFGAQCQNVINFGMSLYKPAGEWLDIIRTIVIFSLACIWDHSKTTLTSNGEGLQHKLSLCMQIVNLSVNGEGVKIYKSISTQIVNGPYFVNHLTHETPITGVSFTVDSSNLKLSPTFNVTKSGV